MYCILLSVMVLIVSCFHLLSHVSVATCLHSGFLPQTVAFCPKQNGSKTVGSGYPRLQSGFGGTWHLSGCSGLHGKWNGYAGVEGLFSACILLLYCMYIGLLYCCPRLALYGTGWAAG